MKNFSVLNIFLFVLNLRTSQAYTTINSCSSRCAEVKCDSDTGLCVEGCEGYSDPPYCKTECVKGIYGKNCTSNCSSNCVDGECHHVTGFCTRCPADYQGHNCQQKVCKAQYNSFILGFAAGCGVIIILCLSIILIKYVLICGYVDIGDD
ncbi:multiple epidermal growth factor-like domains protein 10 [Biomphalaria glabrata]